MVGLRQYQLTINNFTGLVVPSFQSEYVLNDKTVQDYESTVNKCIELLKEYCTMNQLGYREIQDFTSDLKLNGYKVVLCGLNDVHDYDLIGFEVVSIDDK